MHVKGKVLSQIVPTKGLIDLNMDKARKEDSSQNQGYSCPQQFAGTNYFVASRGSSKGAAVEYRPGDFDVVLSGVVHYDPH